jgi:hypothetical protein
MKIVYCLNWYWFKNRPTEPMTEEQARVRFNTDGAMKFTIALIADDSPNGVPFATIETMPHGDGISVTRYTASGTEVLALGYEKIGDRMFAFGANQCYYSAPGKSEEQLLTETSMVESYAFSPDSSDARVRRQLGDAFYEFISLRVSQSQQRSEANWKPLLEFGNWEAYVPPTLAEFHDGLTIEEDVVLQRSDAYPG